MKFFQNTLQHLFIPRNFCQYFSCERVQLNHNLLDNQPQETNSEAENSLFSFIHFSLDNPIHNSYTIDNEHKNIVVFAGEQAQKSDAHIISGTIENIVSLEQKFLAIKTADCLPIAFIYKDDSYFIGGISHAGWRGLSLHIITNTIHKLEGEASRFNIPPQLFLKNLKVIMGPAIFGVSYECGNDVYQALNDYKNFLTVTDAKLNQYGQLFDICANVKLDADLVNEIELFSQRNGLLLKSQSIFPDLQLLAALECINACIFPENISILRENTYGHKIFPSFRESTHKGLKVRKSLWTHLGLPRSN